MASATATASETENPGGKKPKRAVLYLRVSADGQTTERQR